VAPGAALMPLLLEDYRVEADLLFVGMNPSFSPDDVERILHREFPEDRPEVSAFFAWDMGCDSQRLDSRVDQIVRFEAKARVVYDKFFKPLGDFAAATGARTHAHIDMFLMRHTEQKDVVKAYGDSFAKLKRKPFMLEQFDLFKFTMKAMRPSVVLVANAKASDIAYEGLKLTSPDRERSYRWSEMPDVPIFLSGMLSGQRAVDTYSRARLALDVEAALAAANEAAAAKTARRHK
jgi:hypothetical protein